MGGKSSTSTVHNEPPPQVMAAYTDLLKKANPVAATPYQAYTGGVDGSGFEQNQLSGFQNIGDLAGSSNGDFSAASNALGAAGVPTSASVGQYMSPYISGVVNSTMANMQEQNAQQQQGVLGNAIAQGAMGGNRVGVAQSELARQQNLANQSTIANLYNTGYGQALSAAQADKAANIQAAGEYGNLGQTAMQTNLAQAVSQIGAGTQQQQYNYQQYQNQQSYPFQTLGWLANIVEGAGAGMGGTQTTTQPAGNTGSGILGGLLGLGALFLNRGGAVHDRVKRAQGGVIPYAGSSGIMPMNDNGRPAANDNSGYVPEAATGTAGKSTMPTGVAQPAMQQQDPMLQQGMKSMEGAVQKKYPNGILAGLNTVNLPTTAPIPTPNPMTGEAGLPPKVGDVVTPSSGVLSALSSLFGGFADGGAVRRGYDAGGAVGDDPLLDSIRAFLGNAGSPQPQPLPDQQFNDRAGVPAPVPAAGVAPSLDRGILVTPPNMRNTDPAIAVAPQGIGNTDPGILAPAGAPTGVAPPLAPPKTIADLPVKTIPEYKPQSPSQFFGQGVDVSRLPAGMRNNNPGNIKFVGQRIPGIVGPSQNTDQGDPQAVFDSPYSGMRAAADLALRKNTSGYSTVDQLIAGRGGWTPGNHQAAANIANVMGISATAPIDLAQPSQMKNFLRGLVTQEHGPASKLYSDDLISAAVDGITAPTQGTAFNGQAQPTSPASGAVTAFANGNTPDQAPSGGGQSAGSNGILVGPQPSDDARGVLSSILHGERPHISDDMRMALLSAGLGMMASKSPNMLTGIGEGGMQGIGTYMEKQRLNRENAQAQSEIANRTGTLGLEGKRVDIAGQDLALKAKTVAADIGQTTANTAKTAQEVQAGRYQVTQGPAGYVVRDVTNPLAPPKVITWDQVFNQGDAAPADASGAPGGAGGSAPTPAAPAGGAAPDAPVKAAPVAPVGPVPTGVFANHAPARVPIDPRLFSSPDLVKNEANDGLKEARAGYQGAVNTQTQLSEMQHDLGQIQNSAWTSPGTGFESRVKWARAVNTGFNALGIEPPIDEAAVASGENLNKLTTRLGFSLSSSLGSGEAANIVNQAVASVPGGANSKEGAARIIAGLQAANQRKTDYYAFLQDWSAKGYGSIKGADEAFNRQNPPELYAIASYVPSGAIQALRSDPSLAPQFEQKYGLGTSKYVLGQQ